MDPTIIASASQVGITLALLAVLLSRPGVRRLRSRLLRGLPITVWLLLCAMGIFGFSSALAQTAPPRATDPGNPCPAGAPAKSFAVSLINIPIFLNRFGDVVPEGRMYALNADIATIRANFARAADPFNLPDLVEPLVLRVNRGDCVTVTFTNRLNQAPPAFNRNNSIFLLPGEQLLAPGTVTPAPRQFAPALTQPRNDFNPAQAPAASMHFDGLDYDVRGSDGTAVGNNPDSTAPAGQTITYRLFADQEGEFQFKDGGDFSSQHARVGNFIGSHAFGGFGSILVEPPGATWVDARTGQPINRGTRAIIRDPNGPDYRETVLFMHDEIEAAAGILTRFCIPARSPAPPVDSECVNPTAAQLARLQAGTLPGLGGGDADALINGEVPVKLEWFGFNYRAEPAFNREEVDCPAATAGGQGFNAAACVGEETSLSSWPFGDPGGGDLVFSNYRGEPAKFRLFHTAEFETHTFHWHVNRWPFDPADEGGLAAISNPNHMFNVTNPLDVQAVSPGSHYTLIPEGGIGSAQPAKPATFGDVIFHCHLYPHFADGMWGLNRTLSVRENGTRLNPDTTPIPALQPLAEFPAPPNPTPQRPGFPFFVPGVFGFKGPKPPLGVPERAAGGAFPPTQLERDAADPGGQVPGGFFQNPCPPARSDGGPIPVKQFDVAAIQINQVYNPEVNWRNPQSRVYVLQSQKAAVLGGQKPEPFAPLLNVGDCVVYRLTNELPVNFGGTVFDRGQVTNEVSIHQHMVTFDVLTSDGAANGWNYDQGADPNQTITFRDFVFDDVSTNSMHDHFFPNVHQDNGLFGGASIHPAGCTFHDRFSGAPVTIGTIVDIRCTPTTDYVGRPTDGEDYRNVSLFIEDHVPMFQPANPNTPNDDRFVTPFGVPIFPAKFPSSHDDQGSMGINYRLEPFEARRNADPSKLFSIIPHGLPFTPIVLANSGDKTKWRLFQLSQEESHGFNLDRWRWKFEPDDPHSNVVQAQHQGMLEYFEARVTLQTEPRSQFEIPLRSYLYNYAGADDMFLGAWGILEVLECNPVGQVLPQNFQQLPDNPFRPCGPAPPAVPGGQPCPAGAPVKQFSVVAINKDIVYNSNGDHDPNGLMYALEADLPALANGTKRPEPLVIRANVGDCVEVTLKNQLDPAKMVPHCFEAIEPGQLGFKDPSQGLTFPGCLDQPPRNEVNVPGFQPFPVSARVSLRPQMVDHAVVSAGSNVGTNPDSTVGPGEQRLYRWYAPQEGSGVLQDRADVQNHLHHGLYGMLIIEPAGATYRNPANGAALTSGQDAVIVHGGADFREHVVLMNSDLSLFRANGQPVPDFVELSPPVGNDDEANDPEDQGEFSIGYRNEPWDHRVAANPNLSLIFSSFVHGDPDTPLFRAYRGDNVRFRVAQPQGDPRSTGFALHGHRWRRSPNDPQSQIAAFQGQFNPGQVYNVHLDPAVWGGAGGPRGFQGDYLYRSGTLQRHLPGGQWGLFRVLQTPQAGLIQLPDHPI